MERGFGRKKDSVWGPVEGFEQSPPDSGDLSPGGCKEGRVGAGPGKHPPWCSREARSDLRCVWVPCAEAG